VTPLDWVAPANPTNLRAVGTPHAITLFWTPPADAIGVRYQVVEDGVVNPVSESVSGDAATFSGLVTGTVHTYRLRAYRFWGDRLFAPDFTAGATAVATDTPPPAAPAVTVTTPQQAVKGTTTRKGATARPAAPKAFRARVTRGRVLITLPKLGKGERVEIQRSAATKKATFARIATSKAKTYLDRTVRRGRAYRYRLVLVTSDGRRSLPSKTLTIRVPRR
jgi:hypothetical protein